jgi:hypothetical protein
MTPMTLNEAGREGFREGTRRFVRAAMAGKDPEKSRRYCRQILELICRTNGWPHEWADHVMAELEDAAPTDPCICIAGRSRWCTAHAGV